jgi:hypothetical protein
VPRKVILPIAATAAALAVAVSVAASGLIGGSDNAVPSGPAQAQAQAPQTVTMADRERAQQQAIDCIEAAGLQVEVTAPTDGMRLGTYTTLGSDPALLHKITTDCRAKYSDPVDRAWREQSGTPTTADVDALQSRLLACVAAGGVPAVAAKAGAEAFVVYTNPPSQALNIPKSDLEFYQQCAYQEETRTGMHAPYPWPDFNNLDWLGQPPQSSPTP